MRAVLGALAMVVVMVAGPLGAPRALAQPSYPLVCRDGGAMVFELAHTQEHAVVVVRFARASQPANTPPPRAGECAGLDRPMRAEEPDMFGVRFAHVSIFANIQANGTLQGLQFIPVIGEDGAAQRAQRAEALIGDVRGGRPFQLQVRQGNLIGYRLLTVTRLGP